MLAALFNSENTAKRLIKTKMDVNFSTSHQHYTPLQIAIEADQAALNNEPCLKFLTKDDYQNLEGRGLVAKLLLDARAEITLPIMAKLKSYDSHIQHLLEPYINARAIDTVLMGLELKPASTVYSLKAFKNASLFDKNIMRLIFSFLDTSYELTRLHDVALPTPRVGERENKSSMNAKYKRIFLYHRDKMSKATFYWSSSFFQKYNVLKKVQERIDDFLVSSNNLEKDHAIFLKFLDDAIEFTSKLTHSRNIYPKEDIPALEILKALKSDLETSSVHLDEDSEEPKILVRTFRV